MHITWVARRPLSAPTAVRRVLADADWVDRQSCVPWHRVLTVWPVHQPVLACKIFNLRMAAKKDVRKKPCRSNSVIPREADALRLKRLSQLMKWLGSFSGSFLWIIQKRTFNFGQKKEIEKEDIYQKPIVRQLAFNNSRKPKNSVLIELEVL